MTHFLEKTARDMPKIVALNNLVHYRKTIAIKRLILLPILYRDIKQSQLQKIDEEILTDSYYACNMHYILRFSLALTTIEAFL